MVTRKFRLTSDQNSETTPLIVLNDPQTVDGTTVSAQSAVINGTAIRIVASTGPLYFLIGTDPTSSATAGHYLADQQEICQPVSLNDKVAIYGGVAKISTLGA
jgi:hypothetical protein